METPPSAPVEQSFFRLPHNSTVCFAVAILLFFLPFAEFKCANTSIIGNSGIGLATGQPWKMSVDWAKDEMQRKTGKSEKELDGLMQDGINIFALAALVAGLFGVAIAFTNLGWRSMAGMCAGLLAALMLIALMVQLKMEMKGLGNKGKMGDDQLGFMMGGIIRLQFTIWYYLSLIAFLTGAFLNYMRDKIALREAMAAAVDFDFQRKPQPPVT